MLKLLSYFTPGERKIPWAYTPPQAIDGCEILTEQDNRGNICFAFNPVSKGRMVNQLLSQAVIREAIDLRRLLPFKVPGPDMVSNVLTKNSAAPEYRKQVAAGATVWFPE